MGKTVSRCGGRAREVVTCSRGLKDGDKDTYTRSPKHRDEKVKPSFPEPVAGGEGVHSPGGGSGAVQVTAVSETQAPPVASPPRCAAGSQSQSASSGDGPVSELEHRQESILQRLEALKQEMNQLSQDSGIPLVGIQSASQTATVPANQSGVVQDIVVNADPDSLPLSLFIILHQLHESHRVLTSAYVHSSVRHIDLSLKDVFLNGHTANRNDYQYAVTLVWKKEERSPSLMVEPHRQTLIVGEANIARYLSRLLTPAYDSGDPVQSTLIDNWLDIATHQLINGNAKEKPAALRSLNSRLGNNQWLVSSSLSLADIVMWSALHQSGQAKDSPANVKEWIKSCSNLPAFQLAKSLCGDNQ